MLLQNVWNSSTKGYNEKQKSLFAITVIGNLIIGLSQTRDKLLENQYLLLLS